MVSQAPVAAPVTFNLPAAQDARARIDEGEGREGDEALAATLEGFCQQEQDRRAYAEYERERAAYLATCCPECNPDDDATGGICDECVLDVVAQRNDLAAVLAEVVALHDNPQGWATETRALDRARRALARVPARAMAVTR